MAKELGIEKAMAGLLEGASLGDFMKDGIVNAWSIIGQIAMNFVPIADQGSDVRDIGAAIKNLVNNQGKKLGDYGNIGLNGIRFVPMIGLFTFGPKIYKHADEFKTAIKSLITNNKAFAKVFGALGKYRKALRKQSVRIISRVSGKLARSFPNDRMFARAMKSEDAQMFLKGKIEFSNSGKEVFITAADDVKDISTPKRLVEQL